jgi:signal transduction histidine kinase/ActR/RegA family two-component response regulator
VRNYEFDIVYEDGTCRNMLGEAVPLFDEHGQPRGAVGAFVDITERKQNEERLRQTQKLESVGVLAGGIAHDFNNLLTGIMGNASLVLDDIGPGPAELIREVISGAERAANLTRQLLAYSGQGQFVVRDLDVSEAVNEIRGLVEFSIPRSVKLSVTVQSRLPIVRMDPSQLQQILMNLVINAGEAIGEGNPGEINVATSMTDIDRPFVDAVGSEVAPGRYVCIEVRDTGPGIGENEKWKIFDPFFTTKFTGRGLGLAAVAGILRSRMGGITLRSAPGQGTIFRVFLPAAEKRALPGGEASGRERLGTILVVDDDASVRHFIGAVLRKQGYRVLLASDGREALAAFERETGTIDGIVLDVVMPVMGANELLPNLKKRQPNVRVLLTSGYSETEARRLCAAYPGAAFIQKPYTAQQIARAVAQIVGISN